MPGWGVGAPNMLNTGLEYIGDAIAPAGHPGEDELIQVRVAEEHFVVETERSALHLRRILKTVREVQVRVTENHFVGETGAEYLRQIRSYDIGLTFRSNGRGVGCRGRRPAL